MSKSNLVDFSKSKIKADGFIGTVENPAVKALVALTDNSGGTPANTIAAQTSSYVEATQENTVASLAAKINEIIAALKA